MSQSSSYAISPWLTCYTPRPDALLRIFCFPHGGGGPHIYREWADEFDENVEVYALHFPGRGSRRDEPPITDMNELASGVVEALQPYLDKPCAFFGHSVGALVAFEVTRKMRNNGCSLPIRLCVSAHKAPHHSEEKAGMYTLPDDELVEVIGKLGLVPDDALENEELLTFILPPIKADFQVSETYQHQKDLPLPIPITSMGGRQDSLVSEQDLNEWQHYSSVDCQTLLYDGDHFYTQSLQEKLLGDLTQLLHSDLDKLPRSIMEGENVSYPEKCLHELFRQQAERTPDNLAVADVSQKLTFKELDEKTDLLARYLQKQGVEVDSIVGIYMDSCVEFVIAYLAILKASGAYMPLEIAYPQELLGKVLTTATPVTVLTKAVFSESLPEEWRKDDRVLHLDDGWEGKLRQLTLPPLDDNRKLPTVDSLAYCVMTSGTTGAPKGILCPHRGAVNSYYWRYNHTPYQKDEREACNIFLVWEVIRPILQGYPSFIIPDETIYDPRKLVTFLEKYRITRVLFTPSLLEQVLNTPGLDLHKRLSHLQIVWLNGEVVPTALQARFFAQFPNVKLLNDYSISECHDVCTHDLADLNPALSPKYAPLGLPMSNVRIYLLNEQLRPVPQGLTAEIYVGGDSLARGYLNLPEKTAERFIDDPLRQDESRLFRTGDLGMILPNGHLEVKGRVEFMIKLRGYSIVLGAVETAIIEHPEVNTAVVLTIDNPETDQPESLVAYVVQNSSIDEVTLAKELRIHLKERLPHYAIPATFITIPELPLHDVTGKLDRKKLPSPAKAKIKTSPPGRKSPLEQTIQGIWEEILQLGAVNSDDNFFDLGGHSLLAIRMSESLSERLGVEVSVVDAYEYPTVKALAEFLAPKTTPRQSNLQTQAHIAKPRKDTTQSTDIAIIGMACKFPGAKDVDQFWDNLQQGICSIRELPEEELAAKGIEASVMRNPDYRKIGALLDNVELFEPGFWGISKKEATLMDPQQRLFLESCYHAMEDAGYAPGSNGERTGVFGGCYSPTYLLYYLHGGGMTDPTDPGEFHLTETGNDKDYIATRVSYLLNLRGPSITVQTSCSTAAAVVASACQSLIAGQCNMAIAGASSITFPQGGYQYVEGHINSHDGVVRTFDAGSSGTILGDGVGVIVLKRLSDAIEAGDSITAVIKGFSINNDGNAKAGYSAPSVQGQKEMIQLAQEMAGITADTISLIEAHGTGTLIGDPIEVRALTEVFRRTTAQKGFCALGSVKPNIGHSNIAAGMAGLIKTSLCLGHKKLLPLINFATPNPALNIEKSPFYINTNLQEWTPPRESPRRAGVTCLGIGGTNCHFILEEAPALPTADIDESSYQLLTLSAKSEKSLELSRLNLIDHLSRHPETNLGDLAYTLHVGRDAFRHRLAVACPDTDSAIKKLKTAKITKTFEAPAKLVFMFPGQGSQHPRMGYGLYQQVPAFRSYFDQCAELFQPLIHSDLRSLVFAKSGSPAAQQAFSVAYYLQPAIFALQYSLAKTLIEWGITPGALIGHSIGEYTAACIAGIMTLEDTIKLIAARSFAMEEAVEGAMLSVNMTKEEAKTYIGTNDMLSLAVINSAKDMVLSGPVDIVSLAEKELTQTGTICRRVRVTRAFHSPMMDDAAEKLASTVDGISFSPPQIPVASNVSGTWLTEQQALDKGYWATHMKNRVRFADNLHTILEDSPDVLLEVGSHTILRQLAGKVVGQRKQVKKPNILSCLQHPFDETADIESFTEALSQLWCGGFTPDWHVFHSSQKLCRIPLPVYPFDGQVIWKDNRSQPWANTANHLPSAERAVRGNTATKITDITKRGYIPSWARSFAPPRHNDSEKVLPILPKTPIRWLLFMEDDSDISSTLSSRLVAALENLGDTVTRVYRSYKPLYADRNGTYYLNPAQPDDYQLLFKQLDSEGCYPQRIVDFWTITGNNPERGCTLGDTYYHALSQAQAVTYQRQLETLDIWLVTDKTVQVNRESTIPIKSTLFGPSLVLPQENPHIGCRLLDVEIPENPSETSTDELCMQLLQECRALQPCPEPVVAYRGPHRWVQRYEPVILAPITQNFTGRLQPGGIYIITGGMGRIGGALADHLGRLKAKIVLTTRHDFPGRHRWEELVKEGNSGSKLQQAITRLLKLENGGAEVMVMRTNMSKPDEVKRLLLATVRRFGGIDGIFHAAGVADLKYLPEVNYKISEAEFEPKITGLYNLEHAIEDCRKLTDNVPDFVFLFSSLASILGGYSMTAYTAANRVMDSFAQQNSGNNGVAWICANWDDWDFDYTKEQVAAYEQTTAKYAMSPEEGLETIERILATPSAVQVLVTTRELEPRIEQWLHQQAMDSSPPACAPNSCTTRSTETVSEHSTAATAQACQSCQSDNGLKETTAATKPLPENSNDINLEEAVLDVYRNLLELPDMKAEDNFFDVGGDSLLASQILLKLRQSLPDQGNALKLSCIFDCPSVREITDWLRTQQH